MFNCDNCGKTAQKPRKVVTGVRNVLYNFIKIDEDQSKQIVGRQDGSEIEKIQFLCNDCENPPIDIGKDKILEITVD